MLKTPTKPDTRRVVIHMTIEALKRELAELDIANPPEPLPPRMPQHFSREYPEHSGSLTVKIRNTGHLADTFNFAQQHGREDAFWRSFAQLLRVAIGPTLAEKAGQLPVPGEETPGQEVMTWPARPGRDGTLTIHPDGWLEPSFGWVSEVEGRTNLVGGLIFHRNDRDWSIHT